MHRGESQSNRPLSHSTHGGEVEKINLINSEVSHTLAETSNLNSREFCKLTKILSNKRMRFHLDSLVDQHDLNILDKNINKDNELFLNEDSPNKISSSKSSKPNKAKPIGKNQCQTVVGKENSHNS